ncbi:MAG: hypothetical protein KKD00_12595 [Gammaproteobacteria bacterium]|nr:hypothetical protein [Gammaproteobacteria bacterium]
MTLKEYRIGITTTTGGVATGTTETPVLGKLYAVDMVDGDLADGVDTTFTYTNPEGVSKTLLTLTDWNSDRTYYPRDQVHGNDGAALTLDGTRIAYDLPLVAGKITATVAQGGSEKSGVFLLYIEED